MSRKLTTAIVVILVALVLFYSYYMFNEYKHGPALPGLPQDQRFPFLEGKLPLEKTRFEPVLDQAKQEMRSRYSHAAQLHTWSEWIAYGAILLTAIMTGATIIYGRSAPSPSTNTSSTEEILKGIAAGQGTSKMLVVLIGILIALSAMPTQICQKLDASAVRYDASGRELNKLIISAAEKLYNPETLPTVAERVLAELEEAIAKKW